MKTDQKRYCFGHGSPEQGRGEKIAAADHQLIVIGKQKLNAAEAGGD
jgi:hypothetical protein